MAENILAAACESESRKAAKRMRLDVYQAHVSSVVEVCVMQVLVNLVDVLVCYFVSLYFKTKLAWDIYIYMSLSLSGGPSISGKGGLSWASLSDPVCILPCCLSLLPGPAIHQWRPQLQLQGLRWTVCQHATPCVPDNSYRPDQWWEEAGSILK